MGYEIKINNIKNPFVILAILAVFFGGTGGCVFWQRADLISQGKPQVEKYTRSQLAAQILKETGSRPDPNQFDQVEVVTLSPSFSDLFFRLNIAYGDENERETLERRRRPVNVKADVQTGAGQTQTYRFLFNKEFSGWELVGEIRQPQTTP